RQGKNVIVIPPGLVAGDVGGSQLQPFDLRQFGGQQVGLHAADQLHLVVEPAVGLLELLVQKQVGRRPAEQVGVQQQRFQVLGREAVRPAAQEQDAVQGPAVVIA